MTVEQASNFRNGIEPLAPEVCERILERHLAFMREQRRKEIENLKQAVRIFLARRESLQDSAAGGSLPGGGCDRLSSPLLR